MAERGDGRGAEGARNPFAQGRPPRVQRALSRYDISNQTRFLATLFFQDRIERHNHANIPPPEVFLEPGTPTGPPMENIRHVAHALQAIGDELDNDFTLQGLIAQIPSGGSYETFASVGRYIFNDGVYNWGRVVSLFYLAYKMIVKTMQTGARNATIVFHTITEWAVQFIIEHVYTWIVSRGGWESIEEYFGAPTHQMAAVLLAGLLTSALFYILKSLR